MVSPCLVSRLHGSRSHAPEAQVLLMMTVPSRRVSGGSLRVPHLHWTTVGLGSILFALALVALPGSNECISDAASPLSRRQSW